MKKIISIALGLALLLSMLSAFALTSSASGNAQVLSTYADAKDGDILFLADFNDSVYTPNAEGKKNVTYTPSADGRELTIKGISGKSEKLNLYGAALEELVIPADAKVTFYCEVKVNGTVGKNNSIGSGGWFIDQFADPEKWSFYNEYGNWNSQFPTGDTSANRSAISHNNIKIQDYTTKVDAATTGADGYMSMKIEFDGAANSIKTYYIKDGAWEANNTFTMNKTNDATKPDYLGVGIYSYYDVVDTTIRNVKFFKGVGLSVDQTSVIPAPAPTEPPTTTTATTPTPTGPNSTVTEPAPTEPVTTPAPTDPVTEAPTKAPTDAPATEAPADEGGCGSTVALSALAIVPMLGAAVVFGKKKED